VLRHLLTQLPAHSSSSSGAVRTAAVLGWPGAVVWRPYQRPGAPPAVAASASASGTSTSSGSASSSSTQQHCRMQCSLAYARAGASHSVAVGVACAHHVPRCECGDGCSVPAELCCCLRCGASPECAARIASPCGPNSLHPSCVFSRRVCSRVNPVLVCSHALPFGGPSSA
jgi:hypothetical protein